jgi:hypothetical protein
MSHQQFQQGAGAAAYTYQATTEASSSALPTTNFNQAAGTTPAPTLPDRQLAKTHPCTWPDCPRFFACPHNVQQHIREKHTHEKPYKCEECVDVAFTRQYGLNRHNAQVHGVGEKPSRVAAIRHRHGVAPSAEPEQPFVPCAEPTQATAGADDEFAKLFGFLAEENAGMNVSGGDVEMADDPFDFDADQSETAAFDMPRGQFHFGAEQQQPTATTANNNNNNNNNNNSSNSQGGGLLGCGECDYSAATRNDVRMHMHVAHQVPNNPLCACDICTMLQCSSEIDAANQMSLVVQGGFQNIREDENASFLGEEGADFANASTSTTSAWQPDVGNDGADDYNATAGTIDPALLNLAGPSGFGRHEQNSSSNGRWA